MMARVQRNAVSALAVVVLSVLAAGAAPAADDMVPDVSRELNLPPSLEPSQVRFLRERAVAGDAAMQCLYGLALLNGSAGRIDQAEAEDWLRQSAEAGDERGGFEYGKALYQGAFGQQDLEHSLTWLRRAAERGSAEAAYYLGRTLLAGEGLDPNPDEGERWLRFAAQAGLGGAQADLGIAYYSGVGGVRQDYGEALRWFTLAAKQGSGDSCNKLGVMYRNGQGVPADPERAILWFSLGAGYGDKYATFNLANSYMNGEWVSRDYTRAARLHEQAAHRGMTESQYFMGCFYAEGIGVPKDAGRAREWLTLADRSGHPEAGSLLDRLYETPDDEPIADPGPPARVKAASLLREFSHTPLQKIDKGREVILEIEDEVEIVPGGEAGSWYLTVAGCPGVIYCQTSAVEKVELRPGMSIRGFGAGSTGLPGFVRLQEIGPVPAEESVAPDDADADADVEAAASAIDEETNGRMVESDGTETGGYSGGTDMESVLDTNGTTTGREVDIRGPE